MDEKKLDELIEKNIKGTSIEIDISKSIIDRVLDFEIQKSQIPGCYKIILAVYTAVASLFSIFFLEILSQQYQTLLTRFNLENLKLISQGVAVLVLIVLFVFMLFFPSLKRPSRST